MADDLGNIRKAARQLGIAETNIRKWRTQRPEIEAAPRRRTVTTLTYPSIQITDQDMELLDAHDIADNDESDDE